MDPHVSRVLGAVLDAVGDATGYPDVLFRICRAIAETVPCDRATIYTYSDRWRTFLPRADHGTPTSVVERFAQRGFDAHAFDELGDLRRGHVVMLSRGGVSSVMEQLLVDAELSAMTMVPLYAGGEAEGTITCGLHENAAFSPEQIEALERAASHVALLVRKARVEKEAARLAQRRTYLAIFGAEVLSIADVAIMRERLSEMARNVFQATGAWLLLVDGADLVGRALDGTTIRIPLDAHAASADAVRSGEVLVVNDYARSSYAATAKAAGRRVPGSALMIPLVDDTGPIGVLMMHDLAHPRRFGPADEEDARILATIATAALRKALLIDALTRANRAKNDFLASVSHDLRTPLNIITGYAQLLREETFGTVVPEQQEVLGRILRTASDQLALINDLLDLARIEQGKIAWTPQPMAIASLVPSLADMMRMLLHERPVRFETDVPPDLIAHADPERVRQILMNLLTNAAKFTHEGCVRLVAAAEGDAVRVSVHDTGPGIDPEVRDHVLEPFVHGAGAGAGTGLGLAIVARLLDVMRGTIAIASETGRGTRIDVRLPAA
jgi:signal transduction histidine kinase